MATNLNTLIKAPIAETFRKCYIKRRNLSTGLFESDWLEITDDVKSWGKVSSQIDSIRLYKFTFGNLKITFYNDNGSYNPHDDDSSLWYGYLNQQRTLMRIDAGFLKRIKRSDGLWVNAQYPSEALWDSNLWDADNSVWDASTSATVFVGVVSGDILLNDKNEVSFNIKPLVSVFQEYPAKNLTGWTSTGMTASQFITMLRDQTDGSSNYIFRPFFGNTTTFWDYTSTGVVYSNLNTSTAKDVYDKTVWDIIEKLAEAESYVPYVTRNGIFRFYPRSALTTTVSFEFHGAGSFNSTYGHTIKQINSFGRKISKYYSRVSVKWAEADTSTSYEIVESSFAVSPSSNPWVLGHKTLEIENLYIPNSTVANSLASLVFTEVSALKNEIEFTTSFVPHLDLLDRISLYYNSNEIRSESLWDQRNWAADGTNTSADLVWDAFRGDAILLNGDEYKFLSFEIDLDNFQNKFIAREV